MNEKLEALKASISASLQRTRVFYSSHRTLLLSGLTALSILLIIWARMGFSLDVSRFYAIPTPGEDACSISYFCSGDELKRIAPPSCDEEVLEVCANGCEDPPGPTVARCRTAPAPGNYGSCQAPNTTTVCDLGCTAQQHPGSGQPNTLGCTGGATCCINKPGPPMTQSIWDAAEGRWFVAGRYNPSRCPTAPFIYLTERTNMNGSPFPGSEACVEKPQDCPFGFYAVGDDRCEAESGGPSPSGGPHPPGGCPVPPATSTAAVLGVTCGATQNVLSWQNPRTLNASVNSVLRGVGGGDGVFVFSEGGCWNTFGISTYTDTNVQAGQVYTYRIKTSALAVSNTVTCPAGGATPTSPPPTAPPVYPPLQCAPLNQTVALNQIATVTAVGGSGTYQWELSGSGVQQGGTATSVNVSYSVSGQKVVRVSSAGQSATCAVVVSDTTTTPPPPTSPPPAACPATAPPGAWASNITGTSAVLSWIPGTGGSYQQLRVGSNQAEVNSGCQSSPTSCVVVQHTLSLSTSTYTISNLLTPGTTYYWRVVNLQAGPPVCYRDIATQFTTTTTTSTGGTPGTVPTGPGDAVLAALLMSAIMTLLYVSYTHTSAYKRKEIETITKDRDPMDFRS